jgi:Raf kinase inhibitor-like YbhB/YbcL family protein
MSERMVILIVVLALALVGGVVYLVVAEYGEAKADLEAPTAASGDLVLKSPVFADGEPIPAEYTADGRDSSPPLLWENLPAGTVTLALIVEDPDVPLGTFIHWMICEIPWQSPGLPPGIGHGADAPGVPGAVQGENGLSRMGYNGPAPPEGKEHRYVFRLYALAEPLDITGGFNRHQLNAAMRGIILAEAVLTGTYSR